MPKFYVTFMQRDEVKRNQFREVIAPDWRAAHNAIFAEYGEAWAFLYDAEEFNGQADEFGLTPAGDPIVVSP